MGGKMENKVDPEEIIFKLKQILAYLEKIKQDKKVSTYGK